MAKFSFLFAFKIGNAEKIICTKDIEFPDSHKGPEIECNADTIVKYPIIPCKSLENCVLTVKNCNPAGTTITKMLTSLTEPNSDKRLITPGNITHLVLWVQKWKFKKKANQTGKSNAKIFYYYFFPFNSSLYCILRVFVFIFNFIIHRN